MRLDGRLRRTIPTVRALGTLLVSVEPVLALGRLRPVEHRVEIVAIDRAGNRSAPATRRFHIRK